MTVEELEVILHTVKDKKLKVCMNGYYIQEVNGYFFDKKDGEDVLMLTAYNVQPRVL